MCQNGFDHLSMTFLNSQAIRCLSCPCRWTFRKSNGLNRTMLSFGWERRYQPFNQNNVLFNLSRLPTLEGNNLISHLMYFSEFFIVYSLMEKIHPNRLSLWSWFTCVRVSVCTMRMSPSYELQTIYQFSCLAFALLCIHTHCTHEMQCARRSYPALDRQRLIDSLTLLQHFFALVVCVVVRQYVRMWLKSY